MIWITFIKRPLEVVSLIFVLKIHFYLKMKITGITYIGLDLDKCYSEHDSEQHSRGFRSNTLRNAIMSTIL